MSIQDLAHEKSDCLEIMFRLGQLTKMVEALQVSVQEKREDIIEAHKKVAAVDSAGLARHEMFEKTINIQMQQIDKDLGRKINMLESRMFAIGTISTMFVVLIIPLGLHVDSKFTQLSRDYHSNLNHKMP